MININPTDNPIRNERIEKILQKYLPEDTEPKAFFDNAKRLEIVMGLRAFKRKIGLSIKVIDSDLVKSLYAGYFTEDDENKATLHGTNIAFLLNPSIKRIRPIASPKDRTIILAQYLVHKSEGRFDIVELNGRVTFWCDGQLIDTKSKTLRKRVNVGRKPGHRDAMHKQPDKISEPATHRFFVAFYWRPNQYKHTEKVGYAVVIAPLLTHSVEESWKGTEIDYRYSDGSHLTEVTNAELPDRRTLCLQLKDSPASISPNQKRENMQTQIILNWTNRAYPIHTGVFASVSGSGPSLHPAAGLMVWWQQSDLQSCEKLIEEYKANPERIAPSLAYFLQHQRVDAPVGSFSRIENLPYTQTVVQLERWANKFQGYYLNTKENKVVLFECVVNKHGRIHTKSDPDKHSPHDMHGYAQMIHEAVRFNLDYRENAQDFRIQYNMEKAFRTSQSGTYWLGMYTGFDDRLIEPFAGPVILQIPKKNHGVLKKDYSVSEFKLNWKRADPVEILKLLHYTGSESELNRHTSHGLASDFPFTGRYTCFVMGRDDHSSTILPYRLVIESNATVKLVRQEVELLGKGEVTSSKNLLIQLNGTDDFVGTLLFSLHRANSVVATTKDVARLYGVMAKIKNEQRVEASAAVLVPERNEDSSREWSEEIKRSDVVLFAQFDREFKGLLTFLSGQIYRHVRLRLTANRPFRPRKQDYRRVGFYAACDLIKRLKTDLDERKDQIDHIKNHLTECFYMGFAAPTFAGITIHEEVLSDSQLKAAFRPHGFTTYNSLSDLRRDLESLLDDQSLLQQAAQDVTLLGHPDIIEYVYELWPEQKPGLTESVTALLP